MYNSTQTLVRGVLILLWLFSYSAAFSQGSYDLRFEVSDFDCSANEVVVAVEVSASDAASEFLITNENYRFSYNRNAVSPIPGTISNSNPTGAGGPVSIEAEYELSGFAIKDGYASFFSAHTLVGSMDTTVSYNVAMAAGDGYPVYYGEWIRVGTIRFQVIDPDADLNLWYHSQDPALFPNTFIGGAIPGSSVGYAVEEGSYSNLTANLTTLCGTTLPIELSYFQGRDMGCSVLLEWQTITETNNAYFEVEKSFDGLNFESIGRVEAAGNSNTVNNYEFTDEHVGVLNYYQLRQVDIDGSFTVSEQIIVKPGCFENGLENTITSVYPNPAGDETATIRFYTTLTPSNASIVITDISGRLRMQKTVTIEAGPNQLTFDPSVLEAGVYIIKLVGEDWFSTSQKFVKIP